MPDLPPKLFFRIGEVAGLVGVERHVLRYWEREFKTIKPTKSAKGQRVYSRRDVENLLRVKDLLYRDGFTIAGARKKLRGDPDESPVSHVERRAEATEAEPLSPVPVPDSIERPDSLERPEAPTETDPLREKLLALRAEVESFLTELS